MLVLRLYTREDLLSMLQLMKVASGLQNPIEKLKGASWVLLLMVLSLRAEDCGNNCWQNNFEEYQNTHKSTSS